MHKSIAIFLGCLIGALFLSSGNTYGLVTVYDFGASWCAPCKEDIQRDNRLQKEFPNVKFVFVVEDSDIETGKAFIAANPPDFEVRYDPDHSFAQQMGADKATPSLVIEGNGKREVIKGAVSEDYLKNKILSFMS